MNNIVCAICDSEDTRQVNRDFDAKYNQIPIIIENAAMYQCEACGERFFTAEQSKTISREIKNRVRRQFGLLAPDEIVDIRTKLGLSQDALEQLFGLGAKVVTRWETGRVVQSKTADIALRLLSRVPGSLAELVENRAQHSATMSSGPGSTSAKRAL